MKKVKPKKKIAAAKVVVTKQVDKKPEALIRSFRISSEAAELAEILGVDLNQIVRNAVNEAVGLSKNTNPDKVRYYVNKLLGYIEG